VAIGWTDGHEWQHTHIRIENENREIGGVINERGKHLKMKTLNSTSKFLIYATFQAIRHPKTPITYFYCNKCKIRFPASSSECPKCGDNVVGSPDHRQESPIPWWGSCLVIVAGIAAWIASACLEVAGLDEAGRVLVYIPLGALFGMSFKRD